MPPHPRAGSLMRLRTTPLTHCGLRRAADRNGSFTGEGDFSTSAGASDLAGNILNVEDILFAIMPDVFFRALYQLMSAMIPIVLKTRVMACLLLRRLQVSYTSSLDYTSMSHLPPIWGPRLCIVLHVTSSCSTPSVSLKHSYQERMCSANTPRTSVTFSCPSQRTRSVWNIVTKPSSSSSS
jgi:hypothetical protein